MTRRRDLLIALDAAALTPRGLARPGGMITGVINMSRAIAESYFELLLAAFEQPIGAWPDHLAAFLMRADKVIE